MLSICPGNKCRLRSFDIVVDLNESYYEPLLASNAHVIYPTAVATS